MKSSSRGVLRKRFADFVARYVVFDSESAELEAAYQTHIHDMAARGASVMLTILIAATILSWPTDFVFFADDEHTIRMLAVYRGTCVLGFLLNVPVLGMFPRQVWRRMFPPLVQRKLVRMSWGLTVAALSFLSGYIGGSLGGLDAMFIYGFYALCATIVILPMNLGLRVANHCILTLFFLLGLYGMWPEYITHRFTLPMITVLCCANVAYVIAGQHLTFLVRENFMQRRALATQSVELERAGQLAERLLMKVLPAPIARRLKNDHGVASQGYRRVSVLRLDLIVWGAPNASAPGSSQQRLAEQLVSHAGRDGVEFVTLDNGYSALMVGRGSGDGHPARLVDIALALEAFLEESLGDAASPVVIHISTGEVFTSPDDRAPFIHDPWAERRQIPCWWPQSDEIARIFVDEECRRLLADDYLFAPPNADNPRGLIQLLCRAGIGLSGK